MRANGTVCITVTINIYRERERLYLQWGFDVIVGCRWLVNLAQITTLCNVTHHTWPWNNSKSGRLPVWVLSVSTTNWEENKTGNNYCVFDKISVATCCQTCTCTHTTFNMSWLRVKGWLANMPDCKSSVWTGERESVCMWSRLELCLKLGWQHSLCRSSDSTGNLLLF